jgi:hypothetical protein
VRHTFSRPSSITFDMKSVHQSLALALVALLAGCGGSGGSNSTAALGTNPAPAPTTVTNPLTGMSAPGNPTNVVRGAALPGSTVTAYSLQSDGTSGPALGPAVTADLNGYFTLTLNQAPLGMVRLVATGGSTVRKADNTIQPFDKLELITPFVTTVENQFHITPLTDIAASAMGAQAKNGATLSDAFIGGMQNMLALDDANLVFITDKSVYLNVLRGSIKSDSMYYGGQSEDGHELLTGLENLGVMLDLPAKEVVRVVGMAAQANYPASDVDGTSNAINAGDWVNGKFDPTAPVTLKALREAKTPDMEKVSGAAGGPKATPRLNVYVSKYMIMDLIMDAACRGGGTSNFLSRYPYYQLNSQGNVSATDCSGAAARLAELTARLDTNNSAQMK